MIVDAEVSPDSEQVLTAGETAARARTEDRARLTLDRIHRGLGRSLAVAGLGAVLAALRDGLVSDLVLADDPSYTATAWTGPAGTDVAASRADLHERGIEQLERDRADAAIVRACATTGAELHLMPAGLDPPADGIGALLRYSAGS